MEPFPPGTLISVKKLVFREEASQFWKTLREPIYDIYAGDLCIVKSWDKTYRTYEVLNIRLNKFIILFPREIEVATVRT